MSTEPSTPPPAPDRRGPLSPGWALNGAFLGALWLLVFYHIHMEWRVNVVYSYGWAVPLLAAYLFRERWLTRPEPGWTFPRVAVVAAVAALLAVYFPTRVVHEANPDWVRVNWILVGVASGVTLLMVGAVGGVRYVLHFGFPVLFCFTALPWPVWMEEQMMQTLMRLNADICAEVLTHLGMPAIAQGNIIQIAERFVNVEEACSGIRSMQTAFMMSLFLGEYHRMGLIRRGAVLALALFVAAFGNLIRTIVLAYLTDRGTVDEWHDTVGNVTMVVTLAAVWGVSEWVRKRGMEAEPAVPAAARPVRPVLAGWLAVAGLGWLALSEIATQAWYLAHERGVAPAAEWGLAWPKTARAYQEVPFHERSQALLKFDRGQSVSWIDAVGYRWEAYLLDWDPGRVSKYLAMSHYPTVCLPAAGMTLVAETGPWDFEWRGVRIPFVTYVFEQGGRDVHVFHAIIEKRPLAADFRFNYYQVAAHERIASVLRGERNLGQRVLGMTVRGCSTPAEARAEMERTLRELLMTAGEPRREQL